MRDDAGASVEEHEHVPGQQSTLYSDTARQVSEMSGPVNSASQEPVAYRVVSAIW